MLRGILIVMLCGVLTAGAYMIRTQSQTIASLRSDVDAANQAVSLLRTQVSALQMAYQTRDTLRQEADNVANQQMQALDQTNSDWADVYLPDSLLGVFGTDSQTGSDNSDTSRHADSGNTGSKLDASDK